MNFELDMRRLLLLLIIVRLSKGAFGFGSSDEGRVLLRDIQVLTLHNGKYTNARRSSAIPQMKCVGGSAGCSSFMPQVVQCINRGFDGYDVQWECKTDMDNAYRFGQVEVSCEGYEYPDDPYVLRGSCGLEYTLDYTKEGHDRQQNHNHDYYGGNTGYDSGYSYSNRKKSSSFGDIVMLVIVGLIIYALYKTCFTNGHVGDNTPGSGGDDDSGWWGNRRFGGGGGGGGGYGGGNPPPPGFRPEYSPGGGCSANRNAGYGGYGAGNAGGGGGFWTGAAAGGLMGYLFGNRGGYGGYGGGYGGYARPRGWGAGWNGAGFGGGARPSFGSGSSGSTGTRTASGFGGTRRR